MGIWQINVFEGKDDTIVSMSGICRSNNMCVYTITQKKRHAARSTNVPMKRASLSAFAVIAVSGAHAKKDE